MTRSITRTPTGRYSPLRYPGGKGKLAKFVRSIVVNNGLSDGCYVEPYAGGAAVAWELLRTGIVRRVEINDISRPVYCFWNAVLNSTDQLVALIEDTNVTVTEWDKQKRIFRNQHDSDDLALAFSFFFLNRTNRSGILNGGIIGGRAQQGEWKIDARYPKSELIQRITKIAEMRSRISLTNMDAVDFLKERNRVWKPNTLVYLDPPYLEKGGYLYYDAYDRKDHATVAEAVDELRDISWIVSYDDVRPIHDLYEQHQWIQYGLAYSARNRVVGREAMFFSKNLSIPSLDAPMAEMGRGTHSELPQYVNVAGRAF